MLNLLTSNLITQRDKQEACLKTRTVKTYLFTTHPFMMNSKFYCPLLVRSRLFSLLTYVKLCNQHSFHNIFFDKIKMSGNLIIYFCYSWKKNTLFWAWPILTLCLCKVSPKMAIFRAFTNFFQNYWIAIKVISINWITYFIGNQQKNPKWMWSWGKIWAAKLGPMLWKN